MADKFEGIRKILVGLVILATGITITVLRNDIPPNLLQLLQVIFGGFIVGNVGEHVVGAVRAGAAAKVDVAQIQADSAADEPWDDEFKALNVSIASLAAELAEHDTLARQKFTDMATAIQALAQPTVDGESMAAGIAEIKAALLKATEQSGDQFDYATAVQGLMKGMEQIQASQTTISKALSMIISQGKV